MGTKKRRPHPSKEEKMSTPIFLQQFVHQPQDTYSLSNNSVYSIIQDSHDNIWIACYGGGLNLLSHAPDGSTNFIHSGNRLKNYPISTSTQNKTYRRSPQRSVIDWHNQWFNLHSPISFDQPEEIKFYHSNVSLM